MQELVTPESADQWVVLGALLLALLGAGWGFAAVGRRGALAGLAGPLVWLLWQGHKWITRYDPATGYFGLDKVKVLALEVVVFVALGAALGWAWNFVGAKQK